MKFLQQNERHFQVGNPDVQIYDSGSQTKQMFLLRTCCVCCGFTYDWIYSSIALFRPILVYITWLADHSTDSSLLLLQCIKFYNITGREGEVISLGTHFNSFSFTTCISLEFDWGHRREGNRVTRNLRLCPVSLYL